MSSRAPRRVNSSQRRRRSYVEIQEEEVLELRLQRRKWNPEQGLGLTVAGGGGSFPYRGNDEGIFVAKLVPGGVADLAGLKLDDEILSINGIYCSDLEHAQAVSLLRNTRGDLIVRVRRQVPRLVESAIPSMELAPLVRSRSSHQLSQLKREDKRRSRTPDPPRRRRSSTASRADDTYPVEESDGYLRPRTPPLPRRIEPLQHTHLDSSGIHFHPYCFACNPSVIHLNPSPAQLQLPPPASPQFTARQQQHIYSSPSVDLNSRRGSSKWKDYEEEEEEDYSDTMVVRLQRDDVTGLGFIVSSRDGQPNSDRGVYVSGIVKGGVADRSGQLVVGDRIISINGLDVERARHSEVVALLSRSKPYVQLEVKRDSSDDFPEVFDSEPEHFVSAHRSDIASERAEWKNNYSEIDHNPPRGVPLKSSLKSSSNLWRNSAPITTKKLERYPSPPSSPPPRLSSSAQLQTPSDDLKLSELQFPPPPTELGRFRETITKNTTTETVVTRVTSNQKGQRPVITEDVVIRKDMGSRLGLRIAGGKDSSSIPFGEDEPGIFLSRVIPHGTAAKTGRLRIGDRLLKINGKDVAGWTHPEVIRALCEPAQQIILTVRHDPPPEGLDEFLIQRKDDEQFGIKIIGGVRETDSYCGKKYDSGVFVSKVHRGGAIARDGRVKVGMRLLEVNGTNVIGVTRREAIDAFRRAGHVLRLMVCDGWNNDNLNRTVDSDDVTSNPSSVMSNSSFSDRPGSVQSVRRQPMNGSKQPNGMPTTNELNSARSTPSLSKKKFSMKIPDLVGSKHFPKTNNLPSEVDKKTTTIVLSKTTFDKPDREVFDEH